MSTNKKSHSAVAGPGKDWLKAPLQKVGDALDRVKSYIPHQQIASSKPRNEDALADSSQDQDCRTDDSSQEEESCPELNQTIDSGVSSTTSLAEVTTLRSTMRGGTEVCINSLEEDWSDSTIRSKTSSQNMTLKILRAKGLVVCDPSCRVTLNMKFVGETPMREGTAIPVLGSPSSSFHITGCEHEKITLEVVANDKPAANATFLVSEVLRHPGEGGNPNQWLKLCPATNGQKCADTDVGWVEESLSPTTTLHLYYGCRSGTHDTSAHSGFLCCAKMCNELDYACDSSCLRCFER